MVAADRNIYRGQLMAINDSFKDQSDLDLHIIALIIIFLIVLLISYTWIRYVTLLVITGFHCRAYGNYVIVIVRSLKSSRFCARCLVMYHKYSFNHSFQPGLNRIEPNSKLLKLYKQWLASRNLLEIFVYSLLGPIVDRQYSSSLNPNRTEPESLQIYLFATSTIRPKQKQLLHNSSM